MAAVNQVGNTLTGLTGSGTFVGATSPTLVTPLLGTPTSGVLTNCTGLPSSSLVGAISASVSAGAGSLTISSSSYVTTPSNPAFVVTNGTAANVTGNGTGYTILFATAGTNISSSYSTITGLFTAPVAGIYSFTASVSLTGLVFPTNTIIFAGFIINGSVTKVGYYNYLQALALDPFVFNFSAVINAGLNSTVGAWVRVSNGTKVVGIASDSFFSGALIG